MADCGTCRETRTTADSQYTVDIVSAMAERTIKRLWITIILLIVLLVGSNCAWIYYESQFETVTTTIEQDVEQESENGNNSFVGGDYYGSSIGTDENDDNDANP